MKEMKFFKKFQKSKKSIFGFAVGNGAPLKSAAADVFQKMETK